MTLKNLMTGRPALQLAKGETPLARLKTDKPLDADRRLGALSRLTDGPRKIPGGMARGFICLK